MLTETRSDSTIAADVNQELIFDPQVTASEIHAEVTNGRVTLTGVADTYATKWAAERAAYRESGVRSVHNLISVDPERLNVATDSDLTVAVRTALDWDASVPGERIHVLVVDGVVALSGNVDWHYQRQAAEQAASGIRGVRSVTSEIKVAPPLVSHTEISTDIEEALVRSAHVDAKHVVVKVEGSKVILSGKVRSPAERNEAVHAAWRARGVAEVIDDVTIEI